MQKPIIATTLSGLFIKQKAWDDAHPIWYYDREKELKSQNLDVSDINEWRELLETNPEKEKSDYFKYVDNIMQKLYPNFSEKQRTTKARELFFNSVLKYIKKNPDIVNNKIIDYFTSLKNKYRLALITTNTKSALDKILPLTNLGNFFDIIEPSKSEEKDDKQAVFERFITKHNKPIIYIGGSKKDSFDYCEQNNIKHIFVNLENEQDIEDVKTIHNLDELKKKISELI